MAATKKLSAQLTHPITFFLNRSASPIENDIWEECFTAFANIKPISDNRFGVIAGLEFGNVITEEYFLFQTRYLREITHEMRIRFNDRWFETKRLINQGESNKFLSIIALEIR